MESFTPQATPPPVSPALDFFAGTLAGVASLLVGHPFDTVKVRLQTQNQSRSGKHSHQRYYRNAWHAFARVAREEKLTGLYKGVTSPMAGVALMNASVFTSYRLVMSSMLASPTSEPSLVQITLAGSASGIFTSLITTPIERLKILQQASTAASPSTHSLLRHLPLRELYRGFLPTLLRDTAYGPYFLVYEYVVRGGSLPFLPRTIDGKERHFKADLVDEVESEVFGSEGQEAASPGRVLLAGGLAGIAGWGCTFPVDVLKTKMQSLPYTPPPTSPSSARPLSSQPGSPLPPRPSNSHPPPPPPPHPYSSLASTFRTTLQETGWRGFVAGLGPTLVRSVPVNMVTFAVFEFVVSTFR
ncbi:hypothetical protein JCM11641_001774 [Rhodosporidiobolus odoratus]